MVQDHLHEPFQVLLKDVMDKCPRTEHKHSFFELVYIVSGTGKQFINHSEFGYDTCHLFLGTPNDSHFFEVNTPTQFLLIRFNNIYLKTNKLGSDAIQRLEFILMNANREPGCIIRNPCDKKVVKPIAEAIIRECVSRDLYNKELIQQFVNTLIVIVARNIAKGFPKQIDETTEERALDISQYIQTNIFKPEKIKAEQISKHFGISQTYLGRYFKKHTNETMQQYITNYRLRLIENRLVHSNMRIIEIADEMGFSDESHLIKIFKKHKGINPSSYRKSQKEARVKHEVTQL